MNTSWVIATSLLIDENCTSHNIGTSERRQHYCGDNRFFVLVAVT
jgi:hypothetical protein